MLLRSHLETGGGRNNKMTANGERLLEALAVVAVSFDSNKNNFSVKLALFIISAAGVPWAINNAPEMHLRE